MSMNMDGEMLFYERLVGCDRICRLSSTGNYCTSASKPTGQAYRITIVQQLQYQSGEKVRGSEVVENRIAPWRKERAPGI